MTGVAEVMTLSLNESNGNQLSGHAIVALAGDPAVAVRDTAIGAVNGNQVTLQLANEGVGTFAVGYDATVSPLDNGGAQMSGALAFLLAAEPAEPLTLTRR